MSARRPLLLALLLVAWVARPLTAQAPFRALERGQPLPATARIPVRLQLDATPRIDALRQIAEQGHLSLSVDTTLPGLAARITLSLDDVAAGEALLRALEGSVLEALLQPAGTTVLVRVRPAAGTAEAPIRLAQIVVTPSHFGIAQDAATSPQTLTRAQINTLPQLGEDVYRAINRLPGITAGEYSAKFSVRGGDDQSLLVLLDGMQLEELYHLKDFDGALSIIDVAAVGGIDLVTGGVGAEYGDRLTGVFDLHTTSALTQRPRTSLGLSLSSARAMSQGAFWQNRGLWLVSARRGYLDLLFRMLDYDADIDPTYYDLLGKLVLQPNARQRVSLHALRAGDRAEYRGEVRTRIFSRYGSDYLWANWDATLTDALRVTTLAGFSRLDWRRRGWKHTTGEYWDLNDTRAYDSRSLRQDWRYEADPLVVRWGGELRGGSAAYDYTRDIRSTILQGGTTRLVYDTLSEDFSRSGSSAGLYGSLRLRPWRPLVLEAGLRRDDYRYLGSSAWTPRFNAALLLGERTTVRAAAGRYAQPQQLYQLDAKDGDTTFQRLERAAQLAVGLERRITTSLSARIEAYRRTESSPRPRYRNLESMVEPVAELERNRVRLEPEEGRARGVEALLQHDGARTHWSASYTWAHAYDIVDGERIPRPLDQRHTLYLAAALTPTPAWNVSAAWQVHSGWPTTSATWRVDTLANRKLFYTRIYGTPYQDRLPTYQRLDLRATRTFQLQRGTLAVFIDIFNVWNRRNVDYYHYGHELASGELLVERRAEPLLPRIPSAGVTWEF